jgi:hypothetical protein
VTAFLKRYILRPEEFSDYRFPRNQTRGKIIAVGDSGTVLFLLRLEEVGLRFLAGWWPGGDGKDSCDD